MTVIYTKFFKRVSYCILNPAVFVFVFAASIILHDYSFLKFFSRKVMLRVDARQGAPKDGNSPLELFEVIMVIKLLS